MAYLKEVRFLAIDPLTPSTLYAGAGLNPYHGWLFKTIDSGTNWTQTTFYSPSAIIIDPQTPSTLYVSDGDQNVVGFPARSRISKSLDGGGTWSDSSNGMADYFNVTSFAIDPKYPSAVYAGGVFNRGGSRLWKSLDAGANWVTIDNGLLAYITTIAVDPFITSTIYVGTALGLFATSGNGVYKSTDGGSNFVLIGLANYNVYTLVIDPLTPTTIYAGTMEDGIFKSTDGGDNWAAANSGLDNLTYVSLVIDPSTPSTLYAGTNGGGVFKSIDAGNNWVTMNNGLNSFEIHTLSIDPITPSIIYAGTSDGVYSIVVSGTPSDGDNSHNNSECFIRTASR